MRIQRFKKVMATCLTSILVLAGSSGALATPPMTIAVGPWQTFGMHVADRGDFDVLRDGTVDGHIKVFLNNDGSWARYVEFCRGVHHDSTYYIAQDPSVSVAGGPVEVQRNTWYADWTQVVVGPSSKITIPGHGVVAHDTGRIIVDMATGEVLFQAGPGDFYIDTAPFCEFFNSLR